MHLCNYAISLANQGIRSVQGKNATGSGFTWLTACHTVHLNPAVVLLDFCNWFSVVNSFIASICYCMPRLTNNSLAGLAGTGFSLPLASSDELLPVSSSSDSTPVTSPGPVSVQSTSPAVSALPNTFVSPSTLSSVATSWPLTLPSVASSSWLPIPYNPSNPWPPCNVPPSTASSSSVGGALAFSMAPCLSPSSTWQPPFCSVPVPAGVATSALPLDPILQPAVPGQDPILQEAMSQAQVQAQAVLQAQALLHAHSQAHSNAVAQIRARAQGFIPPLTAAAAAIPATLSLSSRAGVAGDTSSHQQLLNTPPSAGLPAPGTFLPSGRMQPASFVVGPGFLPIPDKTVSNIVSDQFIDLASLLAKPSDARSASPLICIDGQVIVSQASKPPCRLTDISQWLQAFAIYMLVMVTYWPSRAADLIRYQLLILRTHAQFGGLAWYNYDEAFRRDAAARQVTDWSAMHVELYNFHTSAATRLPPPPVGPVFRESTGASFGTTICRSWNLGRCVASRAVCRYLHICDLPRCRGSHRRIHCPSHAAGGATSVSPQSPSPPVQPNITMLPRPGAR